MEQLIQNGAGNSNVNRNKVLLDYLIYAVIAVIAVVAISVIADAAINTNKVHTGIKVGVINAGGKDRDALGRDLTAYESKIKKNKVEMVGSKLTWSADAEDLGIRVDKAATIEKAISYGQQGSALNRIRTRIGLWFNPVTIKPVITFDQDKMVALLDKVADSIDKMPEDAAIKIVDDRAVTTNSKTGLKVDRSELSATIIDEIMQGSAKIELPIKTAQPDITESDLESTLDTVKLIVKEPIELRYRDDSWKISTDDLTDWIGFDKVRNADRWVLDVKLDKERLAAFLEENTKGITTEPKDAEFKITGETVSIIPGSDGVKVDIDKAFDSISAVCESDAAREVMLVTKTAEPKLTTEDANKMGIKEKVSSFTTTFSAGQTSRVHNIRTLAASLDGNILAPDQVFSFNGAIGPRTAAKGYREAPAIVNGELVPSLGGGVCQVATTLFNTIFFGGYEVVERRNHSFFISHYPTGRDATVSWGGPDLKFKNDGESYLLIKTITTNRSITINFYATKRNIKVEYTTLGPSNFRPSKEQIVKDPALAVGVRKVVDKGFSGRDVTVNRTVLMDGVVYKKDKFVSKYAPKKTIVHVGTKVVPEDVAPATDAETPPAEDSGNTQTQTPGTQTPPVSGQ